MKTLLCLLLFIPFFVSAQIITTIAGTGIAGDSGNGGPAISAQLNIPYGGTFDIKGNYYFVEASFNWVRKISRSGIITAFAGTGVAGFSGDSGLANIAQISSPQWVATDNIGNVYIVDVGNHRIRKVDTFGRIYTIAGNGGSVFAGDGGYATAASLYAPGGVCIDRSGNIFICDATRIRKVNTSGIITTIVGTGVVGYSGDGGTADTAKIHAGRIYVDTLGNLFIGDYYRIRKVDVGTNIIHTIAGTGSGLYNGDGIPATSANINEVALAWDKSGYLYIADLGNNRVRKIDASGIIHTIAGNGNSIYSGDNGPADSAGIWDPSGVAFDTCGNLYITSKENFNIRKVTFDTSCGKSIGDTTNVVNIATANNGIEIYPNPASSSLQITVNSGQLSMGCNYLILDIMGRKLLEGEITLPRQQIDISRLVDGIYFIEVNMDGEKVIKKFVKE